MPILLYIASFLLPLVKHIIVVVIGLFGITIVISTGLNTIIDIVLSRLLSDLSAIEVHGMNVYAILEGLNIIWGIILLINTRLTVYGFKKFFP
jgi:hypothetical protein